MIKVDKTSSLSPVSEIGEHSKPRRLTKFTLKQDLCKNMFSTRHSDVFHSKIKGNQDTWKLSINSSSFGGEALTLSERQWRQCRQKQRRRQRRSY